MSDHRVIYTLYQAYGASFVPFSLPVSCKMFSLRFLFLFCFELHGLWNSPQEGSVSPELFSDSEESCTGTEEGTDEYDDDIYDDDDDDYDDDDDDDHEDASGIDSDYEHSGSQTCSGTGDHGGSDSYDDKASTGCSSFYHVHKLVSIILIAFSCLELAPQISKHKKRKGLHSCMFGLYHTIWHCTRDHPSTSPLYLHYQL